MQTHVNKPRRRGRPPKHRDDSIETQELLLRAGLEAVTVKGFAATSIEEILKSVGVPKGSFYHYFDSKEAYGLALIERYALYFAQKMDRHISNEKLTPLNRLHAFVDDARTGMARHGFERGCLIGNLGQEMGNLPESFRERLSAVFTDWQHRFSVGLVAAQQAGEIATSIDCDEMAAFFWIGWEGAVLRAKLEHQTKPLDTFERGFFAGLLAVK